jgi:hypothetical protein
VIDDAALYEDRFWKIRNTVKQRGSEEAANAQQRRRRLHDVERGGDPRVYCPHGLRTESI